MVPPAENLRRRQVGILWEITVLLVAVFLVYGLLTYAVFTASGNRLIDKSIEKLKQTEAENISSSFDYIIELNSAAMMSKSDSYDSQKLVNSLLNHEMSQIQIDVNNELRKMFEMNMLGITGFLFILNKSALTLEPTVFASSDESLIWNWEVPEYLNAAVDERQSYIWMENGIPELGLEGEYLIVIKQLDSSQMDIVKQLGAESYGISTSFIGIKPMHDEIAAINDFYNDDKKTTNLLLLVMVLVSILIIALITFAILSHLIRTRITQPIQELSSAAEQVMEGDLDVHITIRVGEEFESLKRAFQSMVDEWGKLMTRSLQQGEEAEKGAGEEGEDGG